MDTYRAAYLNVGEGVRLTRPEHAGLPDEALLAEARAEAVRAGLIDQTTDDPAEASPRMTRGEFEAALCVGEWRER